MEPLFLLLEWVMTELHYSDSW